MLMDMCLSKFDIYQGTVLVVAFLIFFLKKALSDIRSEIPLVQRNIVSAGQSIRA